MIEPQPSFASRMGLGRPELRAWAMYDWANSAFMTTIVGTMFPIYFRRVAADGLAPATADARYAMATAIALTIIAVVSPVLGAVADCAGVKKRMLAAFVAIGAAATALMVLIGRGDWLLASSLFVAANIGIAGGFAFYDSLLPHIAGPDEIDRVSTAGYALGYLGGGLLLAINLAWYLWPARFGIPDSSSAVRLSFLSVAVWWVAFSIPLFRTVPEPPVAGAPRAPGLGTLVTASIHQLASTFRELRAFRHAMILLAAFLLYSDGINTIIRMAAIYGTGLGIADRDVILAFLMVQFVGVPCAFLFGEMASRVGARRSIFLALAVYVGISLLGYAMRTAVHFYLLALLVGMVQGGSQALSRSLFATMIPKARSSEFFALFGVLEKFSGVIGPWLFALIISTTGDSRLAVLSVLTFFVGGAALLTLVDVEAGRRAALEAEAGPGA